MTPARIRAIRLRLGLSQGAMARALGYGGADAVSALERNARNPSGAVVLLLAAYEDGRLPLDWADRIARKE